MVIPDWTTWSNTEVRSGLRNVPKIDDRLLQTARQLAPLADSNAEQDPSREALRLADQEVDSGLRHRDPRSGCFGAAGHRPPARTGDPSRRLKTRVLAGQQRVAQLTKEAAASGAAGDRLELAKAQLALDQDALDDAQQNLARQGGDPHANVERALQEHGASQHGTPPMAKLPAAGGFPTKTNEDGIYAFPRIPIGTYELKVEASGFKTFLQSGIVLEMNQRARRDVEMEVGAVTENVSVTAEGAILQTETTQVGAVVGPSTIVNTPLISRNFIQLTLLAPGVTTVDPSSMLSGARTSGGGRPYVNGNRKEANNFLLDGIDNNLQSDNLTAYQPNLDAIAEFKMITNNASAEFGNFEGGIINVTIKSGTNAWHGNVFEFFRNDKLNANNWTRNWQETPRAFMRWNEFGGTVGGPIVKDKLFLFADYQALRRANPGAPTSISVIPAEFRTGDFSRLLTENGIQLYNPYSTDANGVRQPFQNNQIPMDLIDPVAKNLFADTNLYPLPINSGLRFNQINMASSYIKTDQGDLKLDYKPTDKDYLKELY